MNTAAQIVNVLALPLVIAVCVATIISFRRKTSTSSTFAARLATTVAVIHLAIAAMSIAADVTWRAGSSAFTAAGFAATAAIASNMARRLRDNEEAELNASANNDA